MELPGLVLALLISGGYLLVWPAYRVFHPKRTRRRQALLKLFLLEAALYVPLTGYVAYGFYRIPDFHHGFLLFEAGYVILAVVCWAATYGVWADSSPDVE
jgi:hypothetical protein